MKKSKNKPKQYFNENPIEAVRGVGAGVVKSLEDDVAKEAIKDAWDQLLGGRSGENSNTPLSGELKPGEDISFEKKLVEKAQETTEFFDELRREVVHAGKKEQAENTQEIKVRIHEILIEIRKLSETSAEIKEKAQLVVMEEMPEAPGKYHMSFVERVLQSIRDARMNAEDALAWFSTLRSKKAQRQYGVMAKKHGTSFTLSNERTPATQVG